MEKRFTPEEITSLQENEIFVFGSNLNGNHAGGAARTAVDRFGAVMGQSEGLQGQSYAIPTLDRDMRKVSEEDLRTYIARFFDFAVANPGLTFYLTKIGCGIAGFSTEVMSAIVRGFDYPDNVIVPKEFLKVKAYKAFNPDMTCRGFQYEVGKEYTHEGEVSACRSGYHACENPFDVLSYYPLVNDKGEFPRFAEVESSGEIDCSEKDKICSSRIKIKAELNFAGFIRAGIEWIKNYTDPKRTGSNILTDNGGYGARIGASGDYARIGSSGYGARIGSSGDCAQIGSSGYGAQIGSSGNCAQIGSSGNDARIGSSGNDARIGSSGYGARIGSSGNDARIGASGDGAQIGSSGDYAQINSAGEDSVICCAGYGSIARAKAGSWITLAEWVYSEEKGRHIPACVRTEYVDGERIKADTWYKLIGGEFVEQEL